jgi:O-antigen/teichoic acid export membrane protein
MDTTTPARKSIPVNTSFTLADRAIAGITGLVLIPVVIHYLGMSKYGLYIIYMSISDWFMLVQFGISHSFRKYIAEYVAQKEYEQLQQFIASSFYVLLGASIVAIAVSFAFSSPLSAYFLKTRQTTLETSLLTVFVAISTIGLLNQIFCAVPQGLQRYDVSSIISICCRIVYMAVTVILLRNNFGIKALIWGTLSTNALQLVCNFITGKVMFRKLSLSPYKIRWLHIRNMYNFGIKIQVSYFVSWVWFNYDKLLLARFTSLVYVAAYDVGVRLVLALRDLPTMFLWIILTRMSELKARREEEKFQEIYATATKVLALVMLGIAACMVPHAETIYYLWMGKKFDPFSVFIFRISLIAVALQMIGGAASSACKGMGRPGLEARSNTIVAVLNLVLSPVMFWLFGAYGVIFGTGISIAAAAAILIYLVNAANGIKQWDFAAKQIAPSFLINAFFIALGWGMTRMLSPLLPLSSAAMTWRIAYWLAFCLVVGSVSFVLYRRSGYADNLLVRFFPGTFGPPSGEPR